MKLTNTAPKLAYSVNEAVSTGAFPSRNAFYKAVAAGSLKTYKLGKRRLVSDAAIRDFLRNAESAS